MLQTLLSVFCARGGGGSWKERGAGAGLGPFGPARTCALGRGGACASSHASGRAVVRMRPYPRLLPRYGTASHWAPRDGYLHTTLWLRPRKCVLRGGGAEASLPARGLSGRWRTRCPGGAERPGRGGSQRGRERHVGGARREGPGRRGGRGAGGPGRGPDGRSGGGVGGPGTGRARRRSRGPRSARRAEIRGRAAGGKAEGGPGVPARRDPGSDPGSGAGRSPGAAPSSAPLSPAGSPGPAEPPAPPRPRHAAPAAMAPRPEPPSRAARQPPGPG